MRIRILFFTLCISFFCITVPAKQSLPTPNDTPVQPLNRIVAIVNNEVITQIELNRALLGAEQQLRKRRMPLPDHETLKKQVINNLVNMKLQLQIAKKNNITASNKEVNAAIARIASHNKLTVKVLKNELKKEGLSYQSFRKQIRDQLIISKIQQKAVGPMVKVTQEEVDNYRKKHQAEINPTKYHIANILIPVSDTATPKEIQAAKEKANALLKKLRGGASFDDAMNDYPGSDDLGWRNLNDLPTLFAKQVKKMKVRAVAGPLKAPNGFHIIKLLSIRHNKPKLTNEQIQNIIYQQKFQKKLEEWLAQLRHSSYVHINVKE